MFKKFKCLQFFPVLQLLKTIFSYFWKKVNDATAEARKALVPYFEVLHLGFIKITCDANLVFCSCVLDAGMKT